ncbi:MAG TPA: hypothetical protein VHL58_07735 [Thermoanaerobaculia bacterium]|nr:hypothetical protein [Thermoanaerobaculia bacterium]
MSSWLSFLPHQIPFRAASKAEKIADDRVTGWYLASAGDALQEGVASAREHLVVEAMAQIAGMLVFGESAAPGFLSAIDGVIFTDPVQSGDRVYLDVRLVAVLGRVSRFEGKASREGREIGSARFYLAAGEESVNA